MSGIIYGYIDFNNENIDENIGEKIISKMNQYVYEEMSIDAVMYYGASEPVLLWDSRED